MYVLKESMVKCPSKASVNSFDQHSLSTSVDTGWQLVDNELIFNQCVQVSQLSATYWLSVDQVLIEYQLSIDQDVDWVLINMSIEGINQEDNNIIW